MKTGDLSDLFRVGAQKPLGYLPLSTIRKKGYDPARIRQTLEGAQQLQTLTVGRKESWINSGALFVWDDQALQNLLDKHQAVLKDAAWPTEAHAFVDRVSHIVVEQSSNEPLYKLIANAFGREPAPTPN